MYVVRNRFCVKAAALAACLFVCVDASAQEVLGGSLPEGRLGGSARWAQGAPVPGYMRDSLTFAMRLKGIVPEWKCLPARGRADSVTAPMPDYRAVSGIAPAAGGTPFGRNPYAFDYRTATEAGNDIFYVFIDGEIIHEFSGSSQTDWSTCYAYVGNGDGAEHELALAYVKDAAMSAAEDTVYVKNMRLTTITEMAEEGVSFDVLRQAATGYDDSDPEEVRRMTRMSKKTFKRSLGMLLKRGLVETGPNGTELKEDKTL